MRPEDPLDRPGLSRDRRSGTIGAVASTRVRPTIVDGRGLAAGLRTTKGVVCSQPLSSHTLRTAHADKDVRHAEERDSALLLVRTLGERSAELGDILRDGPDGMVAQHDEGEWRFVKGDYRCFPEVQAPENPFGRTLIDAHARPCELARRREGLLLHKKRQARSDLADAEVEPFRQSFGEAEVRQNQIDLARGAEQTAIRQFGRPQLRVHSDSVGKHLRNIDIRPPPNLLRRQIRMRSADRSGSQRS